MTSEILHKLKNSDTVNAIYFIVIALLLAFGTLQTAGTVLDTENPVVSVVSCSMYPALNVGDILFVQGTEFEQISEGDIIVYEVWNEANFTVGESSYSLKGSEEDPRPSVNTDAGEIQLYNVVSDLNTDDRTAILKINGERFEVEENQAFSHNGERIEIEHISGIDIPIVHRVVEKEENYLQTKGDNNQEQLDFEKRIEPSQVHGKSRFKIPRIGVLKILAMDLTGLTGQPFVADSVPECFERT